MPAISIDNDGKTESKRRFDQRDWDYIAEQGIEDWDKRKRDRRDRERHWQEIDRQIDMVPDVSAKQMQGGKMDPNKAWMAEMELPLQAQALEVLTADARRMMISDADMSFTADVETTDDYLAKAEENVRVVGDQNDLPSLINQDNANKLAAGWVQHTFDQYDFPSRLDRVNAEVFRYGMGLARVRMENKSVYIHEARGVRKEQKKLPVFVPCSIKNVYLDTPMPSVHSSTVLGETIIAEDYIKLASLHMAADRGSKDPYDDDGGWMPEKLKGLEPDDKGYVRLLEIEGDFVVPRKTTRSVVIPKACVTIAVGGTDSGNKVTRAVVRFRYRKYPFSSYLLFPYHYEAAQDAYPTSPLMKGRTVQIMAVQALNRLLDSAALRNGPPISWDDTAIQLAKSGGPVIYPGALWQGVEPDALKVWTEIGGDPGDLVQIFSTAVNFYAELTGILPARLGAQTVSHTTAFAKDAELQRGAVRTVDYVQAANRGPMTRLLDMTYQMSMDSFGNDPMSFFIESYGGFVETNKEGLPPKARWRWIGSGGAQEEAQKKQNKLNALALALQMKQLGAAFGEDTELDMAAATREVLREGGWTDVDAISSAASAASGNPAASGLQGLAGDGTGAALASIPNILAQG